MTEGAGIYNTAYQTCSNQSKLISDKIKYKTACPWGQVKNINKVELNFENQSFYYYFLQEPKFMLAPYNPLDKSTTAEEPREKTRKYPYSKEQVVTTNGKIC
jgi:hypothetical protein